MLSEADLQGEEYVARTQPEGILRPRQGTVVYIFISSPVKEVVGSLRKSDLAVNPPCGGSIEKKEIRDAAVRETCEKVFPSCGEIQIIHRQHSQKKILRE